MLTESEKQWLRGRELVALAYCAWCRKCDRRYRHMFRGCPTDYTSADDFEARVAAKLANPLWGVCWNSDSCLEFGGSKDEPRGWWNCQWCRLKHARLQVEEEEMNGH